MLDSVSGKNDEIVFLKEQNKALISLVDQYEFFQYYNEQLFLKKDFNSTALFLLEYTQEFFQGRDIDANGAVFAVNDDMSFSFSVATYPNQEDIFIDEFNAQIEKDVVAWSIKNHKSTLVESLTNDSYPACVVIPLFGVEKVFGVFMLFLSCERENITQETLKVLDISCSQAGLYIDSLKSYEKLEQYGQNLEKIVDSRTKELQEKNIKLRELNKVKSNFISSVSHELRTPLTSILGFSKVVIRDVEKIESWMDDSAAAEKIPKKINKVKDNVNVVISESQRLARLINDVLDLSKIEAGKSEWKNSAYKLFDLYNIIFDVTQGFFLEKKDVTFNVMFNADKNLVVNVDKDKIIQVVNNLISNAVKFTTEGEITFTVDQAENGFALFTVADSGIGISDKYKAVIFEKFTQVGDTLRDKPQGTGLGLAICREIIAHYNGRIWVEDSESGGSCFKFTLPLSFAEEDSEMLEH